MIKAVRGTRDILPPESETWNFVEAAARDVFRLYNFHEIRTPIIEDLTLFQRSVGEETDIVAKEMFAWEDRARAESERGQMLALRPENTAGVVRAYIEHKLWDQPGLTKLYYMGAKFRPPSRSSTNCRASATTSTSPAGSISPRCRRSSKPAAFRSSSTAGWSADSTTTRAPPSSSRTGLWAHKTPFWAAAVTTDSQ